VGLAGGFEGVNGQRRARFREQIREIADTNDRNERGGATERDRVARGWRVRIAAPALERSASGRRGIPFGNRTPSASRRPLKPELLQTTPGFERRGVDRAGRYRRVGVVPTLSLPGDGPTAVDMFAGIGGATIGLAAGGFDVRAAWETDPVASYAYRVNHTEGTDIAQFGDATDVRPDRVPE